MKRTKPPPFKRDSIDLGRHGKVWKDIEAHSLRLGDIVVGTVEDGKIVEEFRGVVDEHPTISSFSEGYLVTFTVSGNAVSLNYEDLVRAFIERDRF